MPGADVTARIVLVRTSPRIPAGLLSADGWSALRSGPVHALDPGNDRTAIAVRATGIDVRRLGPPARSVVAESERAPAEALAMAEALRDTAAAATGSAVLLLAPDGDAELCSALTELASRDSALSIDVVEASWDPPGARLLDAVAVMDRLRGPGGCPWDAEQTHASLAPYLVEEAHEAADALAANDLAALREELGDVLLQILFHARLAEESEVDAQRWNVDDVAADLVAKLVRRHPHVFAEVQVSGAVEVHANWEQIKKSEKGSRSIVDGVPVSAPSLARAASLINRAARAGLPTPLPADLPEQAATAEGLGAHLLMLVSAANEAGLDAESALRAAVLAYSAELRSVEGSSP